MGLKDLVKSWGGASGPKELELTQAAVQEIRTRLESETADPEAAFFVATQPAGVGFRVGVGFERGNGGDRLLRTGFPVPVRVSDEDWARLAGYTIDFQEGAFVTFSDVAVHVSDTPNPDSRKFLANRPFVTEGSVAAQAPPREDDPALVRLLLTIPGVRSVFLVPGFCSVTRNPDADWDELVSEIGKRIQGYFAHGGGALQPRPVAPGTYGETERKIVDLLDEVIRPAVQRDGGDIAFAGFEEGRVQLYMLGSCVGCPSSMATLKMGVESLLKEKVPEVTEVVAID